MLWKNSLRLYGALFSKNHFRNASILSTLQTSPVLVSANKDIYTNLALEHWLYTNVRFGTDKSSPNLKTSSENSGNSKTLFLKPIVLIWTDEPCVVIGRHQNPWVESNLGPANKLGLKLARRHSGGGCVYHDENNINISIIGDRNIFENRQENLRFLAKTLNEKYGIKCEPTKRHDLIHSETGFKISGSAAKLGRFNCYHHFTLLVDSNKESLYASIRQNQQDFIHTNSSLSTRSKVINLKELKSSLNVDQVITDLAEAYNKLYRDPNNKQQARKDSSSVQGDDADFESLNKFRDELQSWQWIYGMTPKFKLEKCFNLIEAGQEKQVKFSVQINKGIFESIEIDSNLSNIGNNNSDLNGAFEYLLGTKFTYKDAMINTAKLLQVESLSSNSRNVVFGTEKLFATFLLQMIHESNF